MRQSLNLDNLGRLRGEVFRAIGGDENGVLYSNTEFFFKINSRFDGESHAGCEGGFGSVLR